MTVYQSLGYEIAKAHKAIRAQFQEVMKPFGVTVQQFEVLRILKTDSGLTAAQLVDRIVSDSSTMMSILKRLETKVLIVRRPDENDRRNKLIYITGEGQALVDNLTALVDHYNRKISECCTGKELEVFRRVLAKLFEFSQLEIEHIPENGPVSKQNQKTSNKKQGEIT